ncbi:MAG TPA: hypothetical protein VFI69_02760 [Candidatus Limnocylindrales bacterium]|nr:hypothetical protein [Candidatus Limnocylindrales bacterium]
MAGLGRLLLTVALVALGCGQISQPQGIERGGWVWPTPAPLPDGATAVPLDVAPMPAVVGPGVEYAACPMALLVPMTIHHVPGDAAAPIHYRTVGGGEEIHVRWQFGFTARLAPELEIVAPDGRVVAREGRPVEGLGGGSTGNDDTFTVCIGDYVPRRLDR